MRCETCNACSALLANGVDILVGTPSRLLALIRAQSHLCDSVRHLVVDEADLMFSFGYHDDMVELIK